MAAVLDRILRAGEGKALKKLGKLVEKTNAFESSISNLSDLELQNKTTEFKNRISNGESLDRKSVV